MSVRQFVDRCVVAIRKGLEAPLHAIQRRDSVSVDQVLRSAAATSGVGTNIQYIYRSSEHEGVKLLIPFQREGITFGNLLGQILRFVLVQQSKQLFLPERQCQQGTHATAPCRKKIGPCRDLLLRFGPFGLRKFSVIPGGRCQTDILRRRCGRDPGMGDAGLRDAKVHSCR